MMLNIMSAFEPTIPLHVPVLLIIFNRPDTTKLVFEAIRGVKPRRLYVAADGPRQGVETDVDRCREARDIVNDVDWDCEVKTLFRARNLNCGVAPSSAFTWFFQHEEEGIILEDDCVPSQSFFWYCQELLERYRNDSRVMHIGGNNFLNGWQNDADYSYYFSKSGHVWGWATWRRAWKYFDYNMRLYPEVKEQNYFGNYFLNWIEKRYRLGKFDKAVEENKLVDGWDYQWDFARYIHSGLAIVPNVNLVKNIGFGEIATHTKNSYSHCSEVQAEEIALPLSHPPFIIRDLESERRYFKILFRDLVLSKLKHMTGLSCLKV